MTEGLTRWQWCWVIIPLLAIGGSHEGELGNWEPLVSQTASLHTSSVITSQMTVRHTAGSDRNPPPRNKHSLHCLPRVSTAPDVSNWYQTVLVLKMKYFPPEGTELFFNPIIIWLTEEASRARKSLHYHRNYIWLNRNSYENTRRTFSYHQMLIIGCCRFLQSNLKHLKMQLVTLSLSSTLPHLAWLGK